MSWPRDPANLPPVAPTAATPLSRRCRGDSCWWGWCRKLHPPVVFEPPLGKNMSSSLGIVTFPTYGKIKNVPSHHPPSDVEVNSSETWCNMWDLNQKNCKHVWKYFPYMTKWPKNLWMDFVEMVSVQMFRTSGCQPRSHSLWMFMAYHKLHKHLW